MIRHSKILKRIAAALNIFLLLSFFSPFVSFASAGPKVEVGSPTVIGTPSFETYKGTQNSFQHLSGSKTEDLKKDEKKPSKTSSKQSTDAKSSGKNSGDSKKSTKSTGGIAAYNWEVPAGDTSYQAHFGVQDIRENSATVGGAQISNKNQFNVGALGQVNGHAKFNQDGALVDIGGGAHGFAGIRNSNTTTVKSVAGTSKATVTASAGAEGGAIGKLYVGNKGIEASGDIGGRIGAWVDVSASHDFEVDGQNLGGVGFTGGAGIGLAAGVGGGLALRSDKVGLSFSLAVGPLKGGFSFYVNPEGIAKVLEKRLPAPVMNFARKVYNTHMAIGGKFRDIAMKGLTNVANFIKNPFGMIQVGMSSFFLNMKNAAAAAASGFLNGLSRALGGVGGSSSKPVGNVAAALGKAAPPAPVGFIQKVVNAVSRGVGVVRSWLGI